MVASKGFEERIVLCGGPMKLPEGTSLGTLRIDAVLLDYDGPQLFTCVNQFGDHFLAMHALSEPDQDEWLYLRLSSRRLNRVLRSQLSLHEAFANPEHGFLSLVSFTNNGEMRYDERSPSSISGDALPLPGTFVSESKPAYASEIVALEEEVFADARVFSFDPRPELPLFELPSSILEVIRRSRISAHVVANHYHRCILDFMLAPEGSHARREMPVAPLAGLLATLQKLVDSLAGAGDGTSKRLRTETQLNAVAVFPSSFGLRLETHTADLLANGPVNVAIHKLWEILNSVESDKKLLQFIQSLDIKQRALARAVIAAMTRTQSDVSVDFGMPGIQVQFSQTISHRRLAIAEKLLSIQSDSYTKITSFKGNLMAASLRSKIFMLENEEEAISGRIDDTCLSQVEGLRIGSLHNANLKMTYEVNEATGEEKVKYVLTSITASDEA